MDTEHWYFSATQRALAELGVALSMEAYQQIMIHGRSSWELALHAGIDPRRIETAQVLRDDNTTVLLSSMLQRACRIDL